MPTIFLLQDFSEPHDQHRVEQYMPGFLWFSPEYTSFHRSGGV